MKRNNRVRLTESQLQKVIKESVKRVLRETDYDINSRWDNEWNNFKNGTRDENSEFGYPPQDRLSKYEIEKLFPILKDIAEEHLGLDFPEELDKAPIYWIKLIENNIEGYFS